MYISLGVSIFFCVIFFLLFIGAIDSDKESKDEVSRLTFDRDVLRTKLKTEEIKREQLEEDNASLNETIKKIQALVTPKNEDL